MQTDADVVSDLLVAPDTATKMAMFLGAGCSKSSGVPLAGEILADAKRQLFELRNRRPAVDAEEIERWSAEEELFADPATAYGEALEMLRPTPRARRLWLSRYFEGQQPGPAYFGLAELVRSERLRILCTTNFDDLPERAIRASDVTLRVVANDQAAQEIEVPSDVPTILKLHGDYLFDRLANTAAEVQSLPAAQASNLGLVLRYGGMVVAGYGGGDESVMSVIESVDEVPLGLYWLYVGSAPPPRVQTLVERRPWAQAVQIEGFDRWMAEVVRLHELRVDARPQSGARRLLPVGQTDFVAHDRLLAIRKDVEGRILDGQDQVTVITGLAGKGKTTLARVVAESDQIKARFARRIYISAENRGLGTAELLDALWRELGVAGRSPDAHDARSAVLTALGREPTFIVLDNIEALNNEVIDLLREVPHDTKVLATVRSAERLRSLDIPFAEVEHPGLEDGEMKELAELLADRSPSLRSRIDALEAGELDDAITRLKGWPQALKLLLGQFEDPATSGTIEAQLSSPNLYDALLNGAVSALPPKARTLMRAAAAFPATFTLAGARTVARISQNDANDLLRLLVSRLLVSEVGNGAFAFAHPLIADYIRELGSDLDSARERARGYLLRVIEKNGGQPAPDWSNFAALDAEFENIRELIDHFVDVGDLQRLTKVFCRLFSYVVERGQWLYADSLCAGALSKTPAASWAAEWWVWRSWLALYLRQDPQLSAGYALNALATGTNRRWARFQAHRRAVTAFAELDDWDKVSFHRSHAESIARTFRRDATAQIDLLNTVGLALRKRAEAEGDRVKLGEALSKFEEAERRNMDRDQPNTRELNVSRLGRARALWALNQPGDALSIAQESAEDAWRLRWLRGIVEANELVADLAEAEGREDLASSARNIASSMSTQLRGAI